MTSIKSVSLRLWLPVLLLVPLLAHSGSRQATYWLEKMTRAVHEINYDGHFVYLHGNHIESLRTVHTNHQGHEIERLFSLNGEAREIVRDNESVTRILPNDREISTTRRLLDQQYFSNFFVLDIEQILKNYQLINAGHGRVADRMTHVIRFVPRDNLRYGYRLHVDDETALPLQWEMFDENSNRVSTIMFTSISVGDEVSDSGPLLASSGEQNLRKSKVMSTAEPEVPSLAEARWDFSSLPDGFVIKHHRDGIRKDEGRNIEQYIFSDGIASFSVYIEQTDHSRLTGSARLGALNAFGVFSGGYQVTAVGEVPSDTLAFIHNLVKP